MNIKEKIYYTNNTVSNRLKYVADLIDINSINNICDIGAWYLQQTIEFALIFDDAKIYTFEANPENHNNCILEYDNLSKDLKDRILIYNYVVDKECGKVKFYPINGDKSTEKNLGASSKYKFIPGLNGTFRNQQWIQDEIEVEAITLDQWRINNNIASIDCIWLDVQGAEKDVFIGAKETLKDVKVIFTEVAINAYYQGQSLYPEINEFLTNEGFVEVEQSREWNSVGETPEFRGIGFEINTIYIKK